MKILTCTSISILVHSFFWLASEPENIQFDGGNVADVVSLKVKIQQVATKKYENIMVHTEPFSTSKETLFDGKKQQLITVKKPQNSEALNEKRLNQQANANTIPNRVFEPIIDKKEKQKEIDPEEREQPELAVMAPETSQAVASSTPETVDKYSTSDEIIHVKAPTLFKAPRPLLKYPLRAKRRGQQGVTIVSIELNKQGVIVAVDIVKSSGFAALDNAALNNVKQWQFYAVEQHGHAVNAKFTVPVEFSLTS
jgi:protein TonB